MLVVRESDSDADELVIVIVPPEIRLRFMIVDALVSETVPPIVKVPVLAVLPNTSVPAVMRPNVVVVSASVPVPVPRPMVVVVPNGLMVTI